jgi:hypothetical protein
VKTIASANEYECHEMGCRRLATQFLHYYASNPENRPAVQAFENGLICNVHAGAWKRRTWGKQNELLTSIESLDLTTWDEPSRQYLINRVAAARSAQEHAREQREQNRLANEARLAQEWVQRSIEGPYSIVPDPNIRSFSDQHRQGYSVVADGETPNSWGSIGVRVEQDSNAPAIVRISSMGNMSPEQARTVARALILAANAADERDVLNGPEVE